MFQWFSSRFRKKDGNTHPLARDSGLRQLLDATSLGSLLATLRSLAEHLEALIGLEEGIEADARVRATLEIDQQAAPYLAQAWGQIFPPPPAAPLPDDVWLSLSNYYRLSAAAYALALTHFPTANLAANSGRKQFVQLSQRAIQRRHSHEKLQRFRYRNAAPSLWSSYAALYGNACRHGVNATPLVSTSAAEEGTIQSVLLHALMFEVAPLGNLSPEQIECLDALLARDAALLVLRSAPDDRSPFIFAPGAPTRSQPDQIPPKNAFFFGPGLAYSNVLRVLAALEAGSDVDWLQQMPGTRAQKIDLFRLLRDTWSNTPPTRLAPRQSSEGKLHVVLGFAQVRRMITASAFALSGQPLDTHTDYQRKARNLDDYFGAVAERGPRPGESEPLSPLHVLQKLETADRGEALEQWQLADSSLAGLGLLIPQHKRQVKIGTLLGYRQEASMQWDIAVIRRLGRGPKGQRVAGLQILPGQPMPVNLLSLKENEMPRPGQEALADFHDGILLSRHDRSLILGPGQGQVGKRLLLLALALRQVIRLEELLEARDGFALVRYREEAPE